MSEFQVVITFFHDEYMIVFGAVSAVSSIPSVIAMVYYHFYRIITVYCKTVVTVVGHIYISFKDTQISILLRAIWIVITAGGINFIYISATEFSAVNCITVFQCIILIMIIRIMFRISVNIVCR